MTSPVYKRNSTRFLVLYLSMWLEYTLVVSFIDKSWKTDCEEARPFVDAFLAFQLSCAPASFARGGERSDSTGDG